MGWVRSLLGRVVLKCKPNMGFLLLINKMAAAAILLLHTMATRPCGRRRLRCRPDLAQTSSSTWPSPDLRRRRSTERDKSYRKRRRYGSDDGDVDDVEGGAPPQPGNDACPAATAVGPRPPSMVSGNIKGRGRESQCKRGTTRRERMRG